MPMVWAGKLAGHRDMRRVYGPDLMLDLCAWSETSGVRHFFYGGADGVAELLAWCAESGRPCAVATSMHTTKAEYKLAAANLRGFFRVVIGGDQVVQGKPAPDIYLRAAAALGVPAAECGVFEDSEPGVRAAHAAGARVVWVPDLALVDAATQGLAAAQVDSLRVVAQFLRANQKC